MPDPFPAAVSVASWNVHEGRDTGDKPFDIWAELRRFGPDIVCIQEFPLPTAERSDRKIRRWIRRLSGYAGVAFYRLSGSSFSRPGQALVVLSRFPIGEVRLHRLLGRHHLPNGTGYLRHDKGALSVTVESPIGPLRVVCLHGFPFHRFGVEDAPEGEEWYRIVDAFGRIDRLIDDETRLLDDDARLIVAGDFNSRHRRELLAVPRTSEMHSPFDPLAATRDDGRSHDDILLDRRLATCIDKNEPTKSDHHILFVQVMDGVPDGAAAEFEVGPGSSEHAVERPSAAREMCGV